jgi:sec-independent protein translocase protein TatA
MPNIGPVELIILVVILVLVFGSRKLPELGRSLGSGMREFKDSVTGKDEKKSLDSDTSTGTGTNTDDDD